MRIIDISFDHPAKSLYQEMQVLRKLNRKHVVNWYGKLCASDYGSFLMEYVKGGSISYLILNQGVLQENVLSKFCQQILNALVYLHENKIVHQDLKRSNILLDDSNHCKLTGFSASKYDGNIKSMSSCSDYCAWIWKIEK